MERFKNIIIPGVEGKPITLDIFYKKSAVQPVIIYAHGFNGFKDWGNFDLIATQFAEADFTFIKFNFSHNGTTPAEPELFVDLEAYGNNNYTKQLDDLQKVIEWTVDESNPHGGAIDKKSLLLIGHSLGGGIALIKAAEEQRIMGITTWASIDQCKTPWGNWPVEKLKEWEKTGVEHYTNSRTGQQLPLYYQLYQDYQANQQRLDIIKSVQQLNIPLLICHGSNDEAVHVSSAYKIHEAAKDSKLFITASDHVFGRKHPWLEKDLPSAMQQVVDETISFFKRCRC
ncbi:MAG: alpha/beta hydrolase family protein [Chitinophagaceae bacterium]